MAATALLATLRASGLTLAVDDHRLRVRPRASLTAELSRAIVEHKAGLLAELQVEAATAEVVEIERQIALFRTRAQTVEQAGDHKRAAMLRAWAAKLDRFERMDLKRREARALDAVGRLPDEDRFLLKEIEQLIEVNGYRLTVEGWVETPERARACVYCPEPLAPGHLLTCVEHRVSEQGRP